MKRLLLVSIASLFTTVHPGLALCPAGPPPPVLRQAESGEDEPIVDKRPEVKEICGRLKGHAGKRGAEDTQAIGLIDRLTREFAKSGPKDRKEIAKVIAKCLDAKRKSKDKETFENELHLAAAEALGSMGPESLGALLKAVGHKSLRDDLDLQAALITSVGKTREKKAIDPLIGLLMSPKYRLQATAGAALGEFVEFDQDVRKEIFKEVLKVHNMVTDNYNTGLSSDELNARRRLVEPPLNETLEKMSGKKREGRDREFWNSWWNDNKRADWDADREK